MRGASFKPAHFPSLAFRISHPRFGHVLFDTGYSQHFFEATRRFPESLYRRVTPVHFQPQQCLKAQLEQEDIQADAIAHMVLSHLHGDHVSGVRDFPNARMYCARAAWLDLQSRSRFSALRKGLLPTLFDDDFESRCQWIEQRPAQVLHSDFAGFEAAHQLFDDDSMQLIALPGHAPGHYGLYFHDAEGAVFLIADAAWSSKALRTRTPPPRLTTGWLGESVGYRNTFFALCDVVQRRPDMRVIPSHCTEWALHA